MRQLFYVGLDDAAEVRQDEFEKGATCQHVAFVLASQKILQGWEHRLADVQVPGDLVVGSAEHGEHVGQNVELAERGGMVH